MPLDLRGMNVYIDDVNKLVDYVGVSKCENLLAAVGFVCMTTVTDCCDIMVIRVVIVAHIYYLCL